MRSRGVKRPYVGIVHRIDRDTSGVVLLVCSPAALRPFQALFRTHSIERSYVAVVEGEIEPARGHDRPPAGRRPGRWAPGDVASPWRGVAGDHALRSDRAIRRDWPRSFRAGSKPAGRIRSGSTWRKSAIRSSASRVYRSKTRPSVSRAISRGRHFMPRLWVLCTRSPVRRCASRPPLPDDLTDLIAGVTSPSWCAGSGHDE